MSEQLELWFILIGADGQAYKGTTADIVSLGPNQRVVHLRDAVYKKNTFILTGIVPSQLKVYKNKAAFDNREEPNEGPLQPSLLLNSLGDTEGDHLVILVPSSTHSATDAGANCVLECRPQQRKRSWRAMIVCALDNSGFATVSIICTIL